MNTKILVVEDDRKIAGTIRLYLERDGYDVGIAYNGRDALKEARAQKPVLIILDLMLPQLSGTDVCRILRRESEVFIIILTARTTEPDKLRGLDLGADDYVTKPFSPRELMARVRAVLRRKRPEPSSKSPEIRINGLRINFERHEVILNEKLIYLTPAEFRLLETFVKAPERVFTRQELVDSAFGYHYGGFDRTVDAHIMNLRKKIELDRLQPSFILTVYGVGYKFSLC
jgi:Response regulators consisting of a CheY-like receiver domain and a winged-helix DNA-binding domain